MSLACQARGDNETNHIQEAGRKWADMPKEHSIVGDLINFRGLVYAPLNENGVVFLFGRVADDLHMYIEEIKPGFPDCVARRFTGKGWERVLIEFEYSSSNFKLHKHNPDDCDIIVCWEHDWSECPLEVIELRTEIASMPARAIQPPATTTGAGDKGEGEKSLQKLFASNKVQTKVQDWYHEIEKVLREWDDEIWANVGGQYIGIYSPEKAFASVRPSANSLQIECFSRGESIEGAKVSSEKFAPRWARFSVKSPEQVSPAVDILKESRKRIKAAIRAGEPTSYFSGGIKPGANAEDGQDDEAVAGHGGAVPLG